MIYHWIALIIGIIWLFVFLDGDGRVIIAMLMEGRSFGDISLAFRLVGINPTELLLVNVLPWVLLIGYGVSGIGRSYRGRRRYGGRRR